MLVEYQVIGRPTSFWIVATTFGLFLFAAAAPSPLYAVYAAMWQFSAGALTEVFAVYAIALLVALLFTGALSDYLGRRPVILAALVVQLASMLLFLFASNIGWLFAARIAQGIATGVGTSAFAAALVDLQPPEHPTLASLVNSAGPILSLGLGALASAALVEYAPDPLHLVYWLMLLGFVAAVAAVAVMPEPGVRRSGARFLPRVSVEPAVRREFIATLPILIAGWAVAGFYLSLGPSLASQLAASSNRLLGGLAIFSPRRYRRDLDRRRPRMGDNPRDDRWRGNPRSRSGRSGGGDRAVIADAFLRGDVGDRCRIRARMVRHAADACRPRRADCAGRAARGGLHRRVSGSRAAGSSCRLPRDPDRFARRGPLVWRGSRRADDRGTVGKPGRQNPCPRLITAAPRFESCASQ